MIIKVGDRVAAYNHRGDRVGKGVVTMTQALRGDYCKVKLDDTGAMMAFRQDKLKKLVPRVTPPTTNPYAVKIVVHMNTGETVILAGEQGYIKILATMCLTWKAPDTLPENTRKVWEGQAGLWGAFLQSHAPEHQL